MDYAEAINKLTDEVSAALHRGEMRGLSDEEMVEELRRIATEIEDEKCQKKSQSSR